MIKEDKIIENLLKLLCSKYTNGMFNAFSDEIQSLRIYRGLEGHANHGEDENE